MIGFYRLFIISIQHRSQRNVVKNKSNHLLSNFQLSLVLYARIGFYLDRERQAIEKDPTNVPSSSTSADSSHSIHDLLIENNDLRLRIDSQQQKVSNQRSTILNLKKENCKVKKKLLLRNSFKASYRKKKLDIR